MGKVMFFDVDGTLFRGDIQVPASAQEAITAAVAAGHKAFICTGRGASSIPAAVRALPFSGGIYSCGTYVEYEDEILNEACITGDLCYKFFDILHELDSPFLVENPDFLYYDPDFMPAGFENAIKQMTKNYPGRFTTIDHFDDRIFKMTCYPADRTVIPELVDRLSPWFHLIYHDEYDYVEITIRDYTKGTAVHQVLDALGLSRDDAYGFGDSSNDIPMLEAVGHPVVMGDAPEELKSRFKAADSIYEDGLAKAIKEFGLC